MAEKLVAQRSAAKASMEALVSKALLMDELGFRKRKLMRGGMAWMWSLVTIPMACVWGYSMMRMGDLHHGHTLGISYFFIRTGTNNRELYRPEIYSKEKQVRPYEITQFGRANW